MSGLRESLPCPSGLSRQVRLFCLLNGHMVFAELRQAHQPAFLSKLEPCLCCAYMADSHGFHSN